MWEGLAMYLATTKQPLRFVKVKQLTKILQRYVQVQLKKVPRNILKCDSNKIFNEMKKLLTNTFINFKGVISIFADF